MGVPCQHRHLNLAHVTRQCVSKFFYTSLLDPGSLQNLYYIPLTLVCDDVIASRGNRCLAIVYCSLCEPCRIRYCLEPRSTAISGCASSAISGCASPAINGGASSAISGGASSAINGGASSGISGGASSAISGGASSAISGGASSAISGGASLFAV